MRRLLARDLNLSVVDLLLDVLGALAVNLAANAEGGSEDLLDSSLQLLGQRLMSHLPSDLNDLVEGDRLGVLDVLLLLSVTWWFLEGLDDEGGSGGDDGDGGLTVLDGELAGDPQPLPVLGGLGDIFTDFLGGKTERTDLGSEGGRGTDFTPGG